MPRISSTIIAVGLAGALGASASYAQTPARPDPTPTPQTRDDKARPSAASDMEFAHKAAEGGKKEVESARMAAEKATSAEVKAYANRLIADHTKANQELETIVKDKRMTPPQKAATAERETWKEQTGAAFDRAWLDHAIADHEKTIALFETEAKEGDDAELKAWAEKTLPTLREHLRMARDLKTKATSSQH